MSATNRITQNSGEPKEVLLSLMTDSPDLRELAIKAVQAVLNEIMSVETDNLCKAEYAADGEQAASAITEEMKKEAATIIRLTLDREVAAA